MESGTSSKPCKTIKIITKKYIYIYTLLKTNKKRLKNTQKTQKKQTKTKTKKKDKINQTNQNKYICNKQIKKIDK